MIRDAIFAGLAIALLAANAFISMQFGHINSEINALRAEMQDVRKTTHDEITVLKDKAVLSSKTSVSAHNIIASLRQQLEEARKQASVEVGEAKAEAMQRAEEIARALAKETALEQQRKMDESGAQMKTALTKAQEAADAKLSAVHSEVTTVKTQIASEKAAAERQVKDLKQAIGELGIQTDHIATNKKELDALKVLGERNYHEFTLNRSTDSTKIYDVRMALKRTDPKRNRFTIEFATADRRFQKKDRAINEPIQFYVNKTRPGYELVVNELYELVVNEVTKDTISGYLSTPKVEVSGARPKVSPVAISQSHGGPSAGTHQ